MGTRPYNDACPRTTARVPPANRAFHRIYLYWPHQARGRRGGAIWVCKPEQGWHHPIVGGASNSLSFSSAPYVKRDSRLLVPEWEGLKFPTVLGQEEFCSTLSASWSYPTLFQYLRKKSFEALIEDWGIQHLVPTAGHEEVAQGSPPKLDSRHWLPITYLWRWSSGMSDFHQDIQCGPWVWWSSFYLPID